MSDKLSEAMTWLGEQEGVLFIGQGVGCLGTRMSPSLEGVESSKKIEFPVAEQLQLGVSIGLALENFVPISVFPRVNFLFCAMDQLINHLDKLPIYSDYRPKVIIRTAIGSKKPLDAGPQHTGDYFEALSGMLETVITRRVVANADPLIVYQEAYRRNESTLVMEG